MHQVYDVIMDTSDQLPWERDPATQPIAQRIAAHTARRIVEKKLNAGDLLTEKDLATSEGASRTPAREAMVQLENWGLLTLMPKKGGLITSLDPDSVVDLISLRTIFEVEAARNLASHPQNLPQLGTDLQELLAAQRDAASANDLLRFAESDYKFHARLIRSGNNALINKILESLAPRVARLTFHVALNNPELIRKYLAEHEQLAHLALAGDVTGFATLARSHVFEANFPLGRPL